MKAEPGDARRRSSGHPSVPRGPPHPLRPQRPLALWFPARREAPIPACRGRARDSLFEKPRLQVIDDAWLASDFAMQNTACSHFACCVLGGFDSSDCRRASHSSAWASCHGGFPPCSSPAPKGDDPVDGTISRCGVVDSESSSTTPLRWRRSAPERRRCRPDLGDGLPSRSESFPVVFSWCRRRRRTDALRESAPAR